ncbi:hypothetical protein XENOCAPTIV_022345 [Xenoophorus captivus]|uniref:Uncharacterized protein n=1 Tax=Xenoophorus captivus TaxID=1517983 RepID=A0ABV0S9J7_9TELE
MECNEWKVYLVVTAAKYRTSVYLLTPERRAQGEPPKKKENLIYAPSSRSEEAPGSCSDEPTGPAGSRLRWCRSRNGPRDLRPLGTSPPSRGPTKPRGKHPLGVSRHTPKHLALDTENHQYTSGQRHQPPAVSVAGRKQALHLMGA